MENRNKSTSESNDNDQSNYIPFNCSPSTNFRPQGFSSPLTGRKNNSNWRRPNNRFNRSYNSDQSLHNSPQYNNRHSTPYFKRQNRSAFNNSDNRDADISLYYSHEMVEDPWAELVEKLRNDQIADAKFDEDNKSTTSESNQSNNSDSSSSKSGDELET